MSVMSIRLVAMTCAIAFVLACGAGDAQLNPGGDAADAVTTTAPQTAGSTPGVREGAGQTTLGRGRAPSGLDITITGCAWEPGEAGASGELSVTFSVRNEENVLRFASFRVQNSSGTIYRPSGTASSISVSARGTAERSLHTDKFPAGSEDLVLVVSDARRDSESFPLGQCTTP